MAYVNKGFNKNSFEFLSKASEYKVGRSLTTLPDSIDWRTQGYVTPMKDQGSCGSCWAYACNAVLESAWYIKNGISLDLSEQQLVDCSTSNWGCNGGWMDNGRNYLT